MSFNGNHINAKLYREFDSFTKKKNITTIFLLYDSRVNLADNKIHPVKFIYM